MIGSVHACRLVTIWGLLQQVAVAVFERNERKGLQKKKRVQKEIKHWDEVRRAIVKPPIFPPDAAD